MIQAAQMRHLPPIERPSRGGRPVVGFGEETTAPAPRPSTGASPWTMALATSVVGAATGWVIEEIARKVRNR